ncbi:hypothetical protein A3J20_07230 [Candidatus Gottesmanbacteria bacterium RIFCSPLOWO2_02_FULL_42_29]|uniref:Metallopeptidase n=2 Tax=Candidatus Gottesmaniibacteriota TaxID=1752720 RepID=A0A0G0ZEW0_9BACT|nr:MAG: Metallopeptidase [Candidatus Gottesmanbacteria bacterium GW2011_GWA2_42_18]KKS74490.1 MAG: Metallopeptidase [Candidatus Gottesmanbacteria bacterium GW2011_GWC2_42_8]OGG10276.1 MAG: hypothetical protein A2781_01105 [Candidatus Gottesmanbacteria bacterium RIFCSPHIGHO2_01_FULL_42_27]OGG20307.1 MAG: hypothetical protein A3E72_04230 [Candidatus Gottesmanbacteria bacterium RIFCSPHIGHO2_12_FULL_43_26]OGG33444.1 MAG: hypothetical protein A2968_02645 [Candidatus Gottesmanbacteria bacterium RIFCS
MEWLPASDIKRDIAKLVRDLDFSHINLKCIVCYRSRGSSSRARARIWSFPKVWQMALKLPPHYIIEVIGERYDRLAPEEKIRTLIHELMHIPLNFSGSLLPHRTRAGRLEKKVDKFYRILENKRA